MKKLGALLVILCATLLCLALHQLVPQEPVLAKTAFGSLVLDARGQILRIGLASDDKYRLPVTLDNIAPQAITAVLAYEDQYFYQHPGVNPASLLRGAFSLFSGRRQGGSTITMQVARLLYKLNTTTVNGKLRQIALALALEFNHSKQEILEAYFNLAPYGGNVEGIEAASRIFFHKSAASLTAQESIALAVVPQNPAARKPDTGKDFNAALKLQSPEKLRVYSSRDLPFKAPHIAMELLGNGIQKTNIEPDLQAMLERSLNSYTARTRRLGLNNGAALLLHCPDMRLVALAGSANYHDQEISGQIDGTRARRSPGSTLKPFIYGLALDQGLIHPMTILADTPRSFGGYDPENFDRDFRGPVPAWQALQASRNLPAITLAGQLKNPGLYGFLQNAAINFPHDADYYGLALTLGGAEISMRELASLYAALVNQGLWQPLQLLASPRAVAPKRLLSPEAAWLTLEMLHRPQATVSGKNGDVPYYYKTGTSNGLRDAWTAGIIGDYVLIVWLGNFDNRPNPHLVGATAALPLFEEMAASLAAMRNLEDKRQSKKADLNLAKVQICQNTGDIYKGQCASMAETWIIPGVSPVRDSGILRKILIDKETGLRACGRENASEIWWEFWPSDLKQIFARAGIHKPDPPEWLPQCRSSSQPGSGPRILLPKKNVVYGRSKVEKNFRLPLLAATDTLASKVHWYNGAKYLGSARAGEILLIEAEPGNLELMVVDETGNASKQLCKIVEKP